MRMELISTLTCPESRQGSPCGGPLRLAQTPRPELDAEGTELREGVLHCPGCGAEYPVIAGIAILLPQVLGWLRANYYYLVAGAAQAGGIGAEMTAWLEARDWHLGNRLASNYYEENRWVNIFTSTHYDTTPAGADDRSALGRFIASQPQVFETVEAMLARHLDGPVARALDVGTNVGGMALRLGALAGSVVGIDLAYNPVLAARRIQTGHPLPQREYRRYLDGRHHELRPLPAERANTEFLVASATALPLSGRFALITALNVVDVVPEPVEFLRRLAEHLEPGGLLLITSPYSWGSDDVPIDAWVGATREAPSAEQMVRELEGLGFGILESVDHVPWVLREHQRWYRAFLNHCILARRGRD